MKDVFVTDGLLRKSLAVVRSIGSKNIRTFSAAQTYWTISNFSKYCNQSFVYPDPEYHSQEFVQWLISTLERYNQPVLFPMDDRILELVISQNLLSKGLFTCLLPPEKSFQLAQNKFKTSCTAKFYGIDVPETVLPKDFEELIKMADMLGYPVVIRTKSGSGSRGIRIVSSRDELLSAYQVVQAYDREPMVQEYIPLGPRYDVCLLFDNYGECKASFVQKEIRHFPIDIGPSTAQESVILPDLVEKTIVFLKQLNWKGIVEVEYMKDHRDEKFKLMEINPRFWNSLHLAIQSGIDFPYLFYQLACDQTCKSVHTYHAGQITQNLLPGELLHFFTNKNRWKMDPPLLASLQRNNCLDDILSWDDPKPTLGFLTSCFRYMWDAEMWKKILKR